ncbi:MAG: hypothetical protein JXA53_00405 [Bacteroidales bacterium]|nr:hypothetical protein [Bacteroidales bacterium]
MSNSRKGVMGFLFLIAIVIGVVYLLKDTPVVTDSLPNLAKTVVIKGTYNQGTVVKDFIVTINNDNTASITLENRSYSGNWQVFVSNSEMIKLNFNADAPYVIALYKKNHATVSVNNDQVIGKWEEL